MQNIFSKPELRTSLRERRQAISDELRLQAAAALTSHMSELPGWTNTTQIAFYLPADGEIETAQLIKRARVSGASIYLPVVPDDGIMRFRLWAPGATLYPNRYGIPEPGQEYPLHNAGELDIVFLPLVGWSVSGARLGMGGGFYDRALCGADKPLRVGLGFECQRVKTLPTENWDIPLDFVATEAALYRCQERD